MADTAIEWSEKVWNATRGCDIYSRECTNCYAMRQAHRHAYSKADVGGGPGGVILGAYYGLTRMTKAGPVWTGEVRTVPEKLDEPRSWKKPKLVFVDSMSDLFYGDVADQQRAHQRGMPFKPIPDDFIVAAFKVMGETPHTYQVLTKRAGRMFTVISRTGIRPLPNVLLGSSVGTRDAAEQRRGAMQYLSAAGWKTWVSYEPALELVDWSGWEFIRWMVAGAESGYGRRGFDIEWFAAARAWSAEHGVAFFMKQILNAAGVKLPFDMFPKHLQVREYPT